MAPAWRRCADGGHVGLAMTMVSVGRVDMLIAALTALAIDIRQQRVATQQGSGCDLSRHFRGLHPV